jgi:hypothetical protein
MPILRGDHEREHRLELVCDWDDGVTVWHSQRATREEVILDINQNQYFHKLRDQSALAKESQDFAGPNAISLLQIIRQFVIVHPRTLPFVSGRSGNVHCHRLRPVQPLRVLNLRKGFDQFIGGIDWRLFHDARSQVVGNWMN